MEIDATVKVDLRGIEGLEKVIRNDFRYGTGKAMPLLSKWAMFYREFASTRFKLYSAGGGNWPPIKEATRRRKGHGKILRETDTLLTAVTGGQGKHEKFQNFGLQVGISGGIHPNAAMSVGRLAEIHQEGLGRVPERKIIVGPDRNTLNKITALTGKTLADIGNGKK